MHWKIKLIFLALKRKDILSSSRKTFQGVYRTVYCRAEDLTNKAIPIAYRPKRTVKGTHRKEEGTRWREIGVFISFSPTFHCKKLRSSSFFLLKKKKKSFLPTLSTTATQQKRQQQNYVTANTAAISHFYKQLCSPNLNLAGNCFSKPCPPFPTHTYRHTHTH